MISWMDLMEKARKCWIANYERMVDKIHVLIMEPLLRKNSSPCLSKTPDFGDNHVNQHRPNLESAVCIVEIR